MGATTDNAPGSTPKAAEGADKSHLRFGINNILFGNTALTPSSSESASAPERSAAVLFDAKFYGCSQVEALEFHKRTGMNISRPDFHPYLQNSSSQHSNTTRTVVDRSSVITNPEECTQEGNQTDADQIGPVNLTTDARRKECEHDGNLSPYHHSIYDYYPLSAESLSSVPCTYSNRPYSIVSDSTNNESTYTRESASPDLSSRGYYSGSDGSLTPSEYNGHGTDLIPDDRVIENSSVSRDLADSHSDEQSDEEGVDCLHSARTDGYNSAAENQVENRNPDVENSSSQKRSSGSPEKGAPRKKRRVLFTKEQTAELQRVYFLHRYITPKDREVIAKRLKMHPEQVKIWFQNFRYKQKKVEEEMAAKGIPYYKSLRFSKESLRAEAFLASLHSPHSHLTPDPASLARLAGSGPPAPLNLVSSPYPYPGQPIVGAMPYYSNPYQYSSLAFHPYEGRLLNPYVNSPVASASARPPYSYPSLPYGPSIPSHYHQPFLRI